jgi:hypothetical protein
MRETQALRDVLDERARQINVEGYTPARDDAYRNRELARAASCYALYGKTWRHAPPNWPWDESHWKPKAPRENYVRAAALLLAEIERLDRAA